MKLRRLSVNQLKRFTAPTQLGELGDGLNLVVGPNELGKSTLLDALRAVLFERHNSRAQPIVALQNDRSGAAPVVELVFEVNGAEYTLTKRFVRIPFARLQCPDGTLLEADAAESELRNLLGFSEAGNRGATSDTLGMWGVLWVLQGQSFGRPNLPDSALASLSAGLESEVGTVLGGRRGRELPQVIEQRRGDLVTAVRRQPRGEYKDALDHVGDLEQRLGEQQQRQLEMSETLEQLSEASERLTRLEDGSQDRIDQDELAEAQEQLDEVMRHDLQLEAARSELQNRQVQLERAERAEAERVSRRAELQADQEKLRQDTERLEELKEHERESSSVLDELRQAATDAEAAVEAAIQSEASWRRILDRINRSAELNDLVRQKSAVEAAQERLAEAQRQAEQIKVTDESLQRIRQATDTAEQANARLSVAATRISFDIPSDRLAGIEADGVPLQDPPATVEAVEPVSITIPERGSIVIEPAVADRDQLMRAEREARAELDAALSEVGAQTLAEAQVLRDQRRDLEVTADVARQELERLAPSGSAAALQPRIDELIQALADLPEEEGTVQVPEKEQAEAALESAQSELQKARDEERVAREAVDERARTVADRMVEVRTLQNTVDSQSELVERRDEQLRSDAEAAPDQQLAEAREAVEQAVTEQEQTVSALEAEQQANARTLLEARISRLKAAIEQRETTRVDLRIEIGRLRERIEAQDSAGIDEAIEHTQHELDLAIRRREHFEREIAVLNLLAETLHTAESDARERYLAPVVNRVHPYLQMLFPNAEIGINEDLCITGVSRHAGYEERFDHLSMGTQEQIAVLVRLAFAEMLIDQGAPAAVILDDALVFSDDQRMRLMFDILSHAAQRVQILVFHLSRATLRGSRRSPTAACRGRSRVPPLCLSLFERVSSRPTTAQRLQRSSLS